MVNKNTSKMQVGDCQKFDLAKCGKHQNFYFKNFNTLKTEPALFTEFSSLIMYLIRMRDTYINKTDPCIGNFVWRLTIICYLGAVVFWISSPTASYTGSCSLIPTHGDSLSKWMNLHPGQTMPCEGNWVISSRHWRDTFKLSIIARMGFYVYDTGRQPDPSSRIRSSRL